MAPQQYANSVNRVPINSDSGQARELDHINSDHYNGFVSSSPFLSATKILRAFMLLADPADAFTWDGSWFGHPGTELIDDYAGTSLFREFLSNMSMTPEDIHQYFQSDVDAFKQLRLPYLLYS